jgi:hypothetical protein
MMCGGNEMPAALAFLSAGIDRFAISNELTIIDPITIKKAGLN